MGLLTYLKRLSPRTGRLITERGTLVNQADLIERLNDGIDPFSQQLTAEYTPIVERKPLPGLSSLRDRIEGGTVSVVNGEIVIDGTVQRTSLYTRDKGRYLPGLYGLAGIGVRADWSIGSHEYGYGNGENRIGIEWSGGIPHTFVESFGSRYYRKPRSEWLDPLDGTGPSGLTADLSQHVLRIMIGWYGYLRVEYFISVGDREGGDKIILIDRAELPTSGVSFEQPDLPIFAETDGGTLCVGGRQYGVYGRYKPNTRVTSTPVISSAADVGTDYIPLVSMKVKNTSRWGSVPIVLTGESVVATNDGQYAVFINGTLTGAVWENISGVDPEETAMEMDTSATAITGGYRGPTGMVSAGAGNASGAAQIDPPDLSLPSDSTITLAVAAFSGTNTTFRGVLRVKEEW